MKQTVSAIAAMIAVTCAGINAMQAPKGVTRAERTRPAVTTGAAIAKYVAKAPYEGDNGAAARIDILIERWSTDQERESLATAMSKDGPAGLLSTMQGIRQRAGVLLMPGVQGAGARGRIRRPINLYFAREVKTATGTQLVLAADHYLAFGQPTVEWPSAFEVSLLDIRFAKDGIGIGKVAPATALALNASTKAIEVANFETRPARLLDVRSERP
jgi:hypothetical protein